MVGFLPQLLASIGAIAPHLYLATAAPVVSDQNQCQENEILILGAGPAGIRAAQTLHGSGVEDFVILEYNDNIGGRVRHAQFGQRPDGSGPYTIELGANWLQQIGDTNSTIKNPLIALAEEYGLKNDPNNNGKTLAWDDDGEGDWFEGLAEKLDNATQKLIEDSAGLYGKDRSISTGYRLAGWNTMNDFRARAVEKARAFTDGIFSQTSQWFAGGSYVDEDEPDLRQGDSFVIDQRGYNVLFREEAKKFLEPNDSRLHLNTIVTKISYADDSVSVRTKEGKCFKAKHAICTFSAGVLQNAIKDAKAPVSFDPALPEWKQDAIGRFDFTIFTKIFLQFPERFWPEDVGNFVYASHNNYAYPDTRSLSEPNFFPDSNMMFIFVAQDESRRIEAQTDDETKEEIMKMLRVKFGDKVPEPLAFTYPRWGMEPWAFGTYSSWPTSYTLEQHEDLRKRVGNLWFAGEHTSRNSNGYVHGAYLEGEKVAGEIVKLMEKANHSGLVSQAI